MSTSSESTKRTRTTPSAPRAQTASTPRSKSTDRALSTSSRVASTPRAVAPEASGTTRKNELKTELEWLRANGGEILSTKRARPKMTYTQADRDAMDAEMAQSDYKYSSCDSESDSDD